MTAANIVPFIRGAHHLVYRPDGLVRPSRMSNKQMDAASAAGRERAASYTAGVTISLVTTGDEVSFDLSVVAPIHYESASVTETSGPWLSVPIKMMPPTRPARKASA